MKNKTFIDSDVIIDLLIDRQPHSKAVSIIFDLAEKKEIELCTSAICITNVHYIVKKYLGDKKARVVIGELAEMIEILQVTQSDVLNAVTSDFKDFEDAIQHSVASGQKGIKPIVTRNTKDYAKSKIPVFSPETFLSILKNQHQ
ncbi:MAG: PIN domain-containing protein [Bacteroidota bacterium]